LTAIKGTPAARRYGIASCRGARRRVHARATARQETTVRVAEDPDIVEGWQCIGCGRIEAPRDCIGVCEDRRIEIVDAGAWRHALARARRAEHEAETLRALVGQLARLTPAEGRWRDAFEALQRRARDLIARPRAG